MFSPGTVIETGGRRLDGQTLQPLDGGSKPYTEAIYVEWMFDLEPPLRVLETLDDLYIVVSATVAAVTGAAGL